MFLIEQNGEVLNLLAIEQSGEVLHMSVQLLNTEGRH